VKQELRAIYRRECERILEGLRRAGMPDEADRRPLHSADTIRAEAPQGSATDLSQPVYELIRREAELAQAAGLMRTHRPVTLVGIGKTLAEPGTVLVSQPNEQPAMLPLPDKPSVALLPFTNMSGDHEQEFLVDGIAEDVITAMSRYSSLFVDPDTCRTRRDVETNRDDDGVAVMLRFLLSATLAMALCLAPVAIQQAKGLFLFVLGN
jgi:hypothetical protein